MKKILALLTALLLTTLAIPASTKAVNDPPLFSCSQPVGSIKAQHADGEHGVPGKNNSYSGSDVVYQIDENYILQCLCPEEGEGIASNWWRVPSLSQEDIEFFKRRGWIFVPNGAQWGLASDPFLVHNSSYSCRGNGGAVLGATTGKILGASTLAATGTADRLLLYFGLGWLFAWLTYLLNQSNSKTQAK